MRERIIRALTVSLIVMLFPVTTHASSVAIEKDVQNEGYYFETEIVDESLMTLDNAIQASKGTKTMSKRTSYKNASGKVMWYVQVTGTFTYGNGTAKCTKSSVTAASNNSTWKIVSKSASKSGSKATATAKARHYNNGIPAELLTKSVTLTCSPNGTIK